MSDDCMDSSVVKRMHERYIELAAMFKEQHSGGQKVLNKILAKFSLQEGLRHRRALEYLEVLIKAGLLRYTNGHKSWVYNPKEEWELFGVEI